MKRNIMQRAVRGVRRNYSSWAQLNAARYPDATRRFQPFTEAFAKPKMWATTAFLALITIVAVNIATQTQQTPHSSAATPTAANIWIEPNAGGCVRSATLVTYGASGSPDNRCGSFDAAYEAAALGDVVLIRNGDYPGQNMNGPLKSAGEQITFYGESENGVTVDWINMDNVSYVTLKDFKLTDPDFAGSAWDKMLALADTRSITLDNVDLDRNYKKADGAHLGGGVVDFVWKNSDVCCNAEQKLIMMHPYRSSPSTDGALFENLTVHDQVYTATSYQGEPPHAECWWMLESKDVTIRNTKTYDCISTGNMIWGGTANNKGVHFVNTFWGKKHGFQNGVDVIPGPQVGYRGDVGGVLIDGENTNGTGVIEYSTFEGGIVDDGWASLTLRGNIGFKYQFSCKSDPNYKYINNIWSHAKCSNVNGSDNDPVENILDAANYVNKAAGDWRPVAGAPQIDKGDPSSCPAKDITGHVRPAGQRCDVGAYEYGSSPTGPIMAHLWVDTTTANTTAGGTCTRQPNTGLYVDAQACATFDQAWDSAQDGDIIRIKAGRYAAQGVTGDKTKPTYLIGEEGTVIGTGTTVLCRDTYGGDGTFCSDASYLNLENVTIDSGLQKGTGVSSAIYRPNITWRNVNLDGQYAAMSVNAADFSWIKGRHGPAGQTAGPLKCHQQGAALGGSLPIWLFAPGAVFDGIEIRPRSFEAVPDGSVPGCPDNVPHIETFRFEDQADNITIKNTHFVAGSDAGSGHLFASVAVTDVKLINNYFGAVNGTYWAQVNNPGNANWTMLYNTFAQPAILGASNQVWVGNLGVQQGCTGTHIKNVWSGSGSCGTDTYVGSTPLGIDAGSGRISSSSPAIDAAETPDASDYCTNNLVNSRDFEGATRPAGARCDAGAHEYGATGGNPDPDPTPTDTTPPTVSLSSPASGATVSGAVTVSATASDPASTPTATGIAKVEFKLDGVIVHTDTEAPFSYSWNTNQAANGSHSLSAVATDGAGNATESTVITVTVTGGLNLSASLLAAYAFNEGSGATSADLSGRGHTMTLTNATWAGASAGKYSNGLALNGTTSYAATPDTNPDPAFTLDLTTNGTISAWAKFDAPLKNWQALIAKGVGNNDNLHNYALMLNGAGQPQCNLATSSTPVQAAANVAAPTGAFVHYACAWDATTLRLYVNGVEAATAALNGRTPLANNSPLAVGVFGGSYDYLDGVIDDVRISKLTLSASDITTDMNTPLTALGGEPTPDPDTTPPAIALTSPTANATLRGTVALAAIATDAVAMKEVQFHRCNSSGGGCVDIGTVVPVAAATGNPATTYGLSYDTTTVANGTYRLTATAYDAAGNQATALQVSVAIDNAAPAPEPEPNPGGDQQNSSSKPKPGDLDGNGRVQLRDLSMLLARYGQTGQGNLADLDGNGKVELRDLSMLLARWEG